MPFTRRTFLAFGLKCPAAEAKIRSLSNAVAKVKSVTLLGPAAAQLKFRQITEALIVVMPPAADSIDLYALRIEGSILSERYRGTTWRKEPQHFIM